MSDYLRESPDEGNELRKRQRVEETTREERNEEVNRRTTQPVEGVRRQSGPGSEGQTFMSRAGYRTTELRTIPADFRHDNTSADSDAPGRRVEVWSNYIKLSQMQERLIYQYRVDFEPNIESVSLRRKVFGIATQTSFARKVVFDGLSDARSGFKLAKEVTTLYEDNPSQPDTKIEITIKQVGIVNWGSFEMLRVYNMNMKKFLLALGFYQIGQAGAYVHPALATPIGSSETIMTVRGFRTAANVHESGNILMNLESVHKLMQRRTVLQCMVDYQKNQNMREALKAAFTGKIVVTSYNKVVYKIEDINFSLSPQSTFFNRKQNRDMSYMEYYQSRYDVRINDKNQPLLLVIQNNKRQAEEKGDAGSDIYIIPELCRIAGLTEYQRDDNRLKIDLVRASQISPSDKVKHMQTFLLKLHECQEVSDTLNKWGYGYDKDPVRIKARILPTESIGMGKAASGPADRWTKVDNMASFDGPIQRENVAKVPPFPKMHIVISIKDSQNEKAIVEKLRRGFQRVGVVPEEVSFSRMREGDGAHTYVQYIRQIPQDVSATLVILSNQNKERYDAVKKIASVERGMITQVVTSRLMMDDRKANGAAVKIGIQVAAKLGGEPWYVHLPMTGAMVCGYDTYHDTAKRGRSFGAFLASMNNRFSRWFSKADSHDRIDELSSHLAENLGNALTKYKELNERYPDRVFIYRDGVSDGQLEHVFNVELKHLKRVVKACDERIRLTIIVVNKRVGARFYMKNNATFANCPPGSVIDDVVTRKERYDFYLVSQSTRNGTVAPTYYNIIHDESGLDPSKHQSMAYKMCFLYYNWTGTVRVPAPCQYAHKLALLCGEHLHAIPNANLDDRLHFL